MYGIESAPKKQSKVKAPYVYELEKMLKEPKVLKKMLDNCNTRLLTLKDMTRKGVSPEEFNQLHLLLQGYTALKKVILKATKN